MRTRFRIPARRSPPGRGGFFPLIMPGMRRPPAGVVGEDLPRPLPLED